MQKTTMLRIMSLIVILTATGCSTYQNIDIHPKINQTAPTYLTSPPLSKGDVARYTLKDGRKGETVIESVSSQMLTGTNGEQIPLQQIISLERAKISRGKTAAAIGAGIGAGAVVVVAVLSVGLATALIAAAG